MMLLELLDDMNLFSGELLKVLTISLNLESSGAPCNTSEPQSRKIFFMRLWEFFFKMIGGRSPNGATLSQSELRHGFAKMQP